MAADILAAAVELFGEQGYDNVSMRELAARAGCSPANLYHHHRSKYDIFVLLMRRAMELHLAGLREALVVHDDPVAQLRHVLSRHLLLHMERPEVRLLGSDFHPLHGDERQRFIAQRDEYERGVREIVARAAARGLVRVEDPKLAVMTALAACTQVDRWYRPEGELDSADVARRITAFLLAGFGVAASREAAWSAGPPAPRRRRAAPPPDRLPRRAGPPPNRSPRPGVETDADHGAASRRGSSELFTIKGYVDANGRT